MYRRATNMLYRAARAQPRNLFQHCERNLMVTSLNSPAECFEAIRERSPHQKEFLQAVHEVIESLYPLFAKYPQYTYILPVICEPERIIQFRVPWVNDQGHTHVNRGFRVQFNQALGPYKGGLRFHPTVNSSIVKFLGFEQIFKNALTGLALGGAKGGSDFNPKGKSEAEVLRFCQSFMSELHAYIGADVDVPAGDIGVGGREIGYLFGQWKRITCLHEGVLTGKGILWGGSHIRPEATGYGLVYFTLNHMHEAGDTMKGKRVAISGSGNVAEFAAEKTIMEGGTVVSFSDSNGVIIEEKGFTEDQINKVRQIKANRGRVREYTKFSDSCKYIEGERPWKHVQCDVAFPCATQNEVDASDVDALLKSGCKYIGEGANMPSTPDAIDLAKKNGMIFLPAKAANAGGVAVSGLEMAQNAEKLIWNREKVDEFLRNIMESIYVECRDTAIHLGHEGDFQLGANAAGFRKVADAMFECGMVLPYDANMGMTGWKAKTN